MKPCSLRFFLFRMIAGSQELKVCPMKAASRRFANVGESLKQSKRLTRFEVRRPVVNVPNNKRLTNSQSLAIDHVRQYARSRKKEAQQTIQEILWMSNLDWAAFERVKSKITTNARVALHFHPDRPLADMKSVAQALLEQGTGSDSQEADASAFVSIGTTVSGPFMSRTKAQP